MSFQQISYLYSSGGWSWENSSSSRLNDAWIRMSRVLCFVTSQMSIKFSFSKYISTFYCSSPPRSFQSPWQWIFKRIWYSGICVQTRKVTLVLFTSPSAPSTWPLRVVLVPLLLLLVDLLRSLLANSCLQPSAPWDRDLLNMSLRMLYFVFTTADWVQRLNG